MCVYDLLNHICLLCLREAMAKQGRSSSAGMVGHRIIVFYTCPDEGGMVQTISCKTSFLGSEPAPFLENIKHHERDEDHYSNGKIESPFMMSIGDYIKVHPENSTNYSSRS